MLELPNKDHVVSDPKPNPTLTKSIVLVMHGSIVTINQNGDPCGANPVTVSYQSTVKMPRPNSGLSSWTRTLWKVPRRVADVKVRPGFSLLSPTEKAPNARRLIPKRVTQEMVPPKWHAETPIREASTQDNTIYSVQIAIIYY